MTGSATKTVSKHRLLLVVITLATGHLITSWLLARPYRFFPCDDTLYYQFLLAGSHTLPGVYIHPVYASFLLLCKQLWNGFAAISPSTLIFANLLANTASMTMIILSSRRLTGSLAWAVAAGLIFATSTWTVNYYFMFSYVPFEVALIISAFTMQIYGVHSEGRIANILFVTSGLLLALAFWCSPSAAVSIFLVLATFPLLGVGRMPGRRQIWYACTCVATGFTLVFLPYAFISGRAYLYHVLGNIHTDHYRDAIIKFGHVPAPPFFSFFRLLFEYAPVEAMIFPILATVAFLPLFNRRNRADQSLQMCAILAAICLAHNLIVDLLPTTKLGRTHFHAYPFLIIFIIVTAHWVYSQTAARKLHKILGGIFMVLLLMSVSLSIRQTMQTSATRTAVPEFLGRQPASTSIYLFQEDPHADYIKQWLDDPRISLINNQSLGSLISEAKEKGAHGMLVIGPTGPGSGNSILEHATMADFYPMIPDNIADRFTYLPYYAFQPSFLFEEENSLALYFLGETPLPDSPAAKIKILSW